MMELNNVDNELLGIVADLHSVPQGAFNIRKNGKSIARSSSASIEIETNSTGDGINIKIKDGTRNESVHIPVILTQSGLTESVRNDFFIGDNCDITIIAGCGIHNGGDKLSSHSGIHHFFIGTNSKVKYIEKHFGVGKLEKQEMHPETIINIGVNSVFEMETSQLGGISNSIRKTSATLADNASLNINEKILTENRQAAETDFFAELNGKNSSAHIVSRAVAKGESVQKFKSILNGKEKCFGHTECDCIVMDKAKVFATPEVNALSTDASLIHEAAIGKIAGEQITKLMTLGLTEEEAQNQIIKGFLG